MKRTSIAIMLLTMISVTELKSQQLTLPPLPDGTLEQLQQQSQGSLLGLLSEGSNSSTLGADDLKNISGFIVTYETADDTADNETSPPTSATSFAAASQLGVTIDNIRPNTWELQISPFPTNINSSGSAAEQDHSEIIQKLWEALNNDNSVKSWYPNYNLEHKANEIDPLLKFQWHFHDRGDLSSKSAPGGTNISKLWDYIPGSHDVVVAVLDTGYLFDHPD